MRVRPLRQKFMILLTHYWYQIWSEVPENVQGIKNSLKTRVDFWNILQNRRVHGTQWDCLIVGKSEISTVNKMKWNTVTNEPNIFIFFIYIVLTIASIQCTFKTYNIKMSVNFRERFGQPKPYLWTIRHPAYHWCTLDLGAQPFGLLVVRISGPQASRDQFSWMLVCAQRFPF